MQELEKALDRLIREFFPNWRLETLPPGGASVVADFIDGTREFYQYIRPIAKDPASSAASFAAEITPFDPAGDSE